MNILFFGDIVGKVGRTTIYKYIEQLKTKYNIDFVIANAENATHGKGLSLKHYQELSSFGINCMTMGNHYFRVNEIITENDKYVNMIRPLNLHPSIKGKGSKEFIVKGKKVRVTNLMGRSFMTGTDLNPFDSLNELINSTSSDIHIVDMHAETTSEKLAIAYAFDGKITAVLGTHTHVQTNDDKILKNGTGVICDVGMNGLYDSILGVEPLEVVKKTWYQDVEKFKIPETGIGQINAIVLFIDDNSNKLTKMEKINFIDN